jgi:hypothetical protein
MNNEVENIFQSFETGKTIQHFALSLVISGFFSIIVCAYYVLFFLSFFLSDALVFICCFSILLKR